MVIPFITLRLVKVFHEFPRETYEAALNMGPFTEVIYGCIWLYLSAMRDGLSAIALWSGLCDGGHPHRLCILVPYYIRGSIPNITDAFMALPYHFGTFGQRRLFSRFSLCYSLCIDGYIAFVLISFVAA